VALVLGTFVEPDGCMSQMLADRVQRAAQLWRAGKVARILVSGDHHTWTYDEPDTMRKAHSYGTQGELSSLREVLARVKAVYQGATDQKVLLGPRIAITGNGRSSWGPSGPPS
jgi:vancomycin permeability regulator SanA